MSLTKEEKGKIYKEALKIIEAKGLIKTAYHLKIKTDLNERVDWLFRFKKVFTDNKEATIQKLFVIKHNFKDDYSFDELRKFDLISIITPSLSFKNAMNTYRTIFIGFEEHLKILDDLEPETFVKTKKTDKVEKDKDGIPKFIHPINRDIANKYLDKYLSEYKALIEVLIEAFPEREEVCEAIPKNTKVEETRGLIPDCPVRKEFTILYYKSYRSQIESKAERTKKGHIIQNSVYKVLKNKLFPILDHIHHDTIRDWITEKGKK